MWDRTKHHNIHSKWSVCVLAFPKWVHRYTRGAWACVCEVRCVIFMLMGFTSAENGNRSSIDHELFAFHHEVITEDIMDAFTRRNRQEPRLIMREEVCVYSDIRVSVISFRLNFQIRRLQTRRHVYVALSV